MTMPILVDNKMYPVYGYQRKAFEFICYHGAVYLMLDMGMGKTRICIEVSKALDIPMFILAPRFAALETWPDELQKWDRFAKFAVLHGPKKEQRWANSDKDTNIILNYDGLKWFFKVANKKLRPLQKYFFVFDESSMIKNWQTNRWLILNHMMPIMSNYRVCLSGTPAPNTLEDLWAQYYFLDKGRALCPDFYQFRNRFFDPPAFDHEYNHVIKPWAEEKIFELIKPMTMRLDSEDYLDLPELKYNTIKIKLPSGLRRQYQKFEDEFMLEFPDATVLARSSAVRDLKLRQFLQGAVYGQDLSEEGSRHRLPRVVKYLHDIKAKVLKQICETSVGQPVLAAVQFKFEKQIIRKVMGYDVPCIDGETSGSKGKQLIQKWNQGKLPLLLVHPQSVGYGLNLQSGGNILVWLALPWELDLYQQLVKRLHRQGQKADRVLVHTLAFKGTVDMKVAKYLGRKDATQKGLFNAIARR